MKIKSTRNIQKVAEKTEGDTLFQKYELPDGTRFVMTSRPNAVSPRESVRYYIEGSYLPNKVFEPVISFIQSLSCRDDVEAARLPLLARVAVREAQMHRARSEKSKAKLRRDIVAAQRSLDKLPTTAPSAPNSASPALPQPAPVAPEPQQALPTERGVMMDADEATRVQQAINTVLDYVSGEEKVNPGKLAGAVRRLTDLRALLD